MCFSSYKNHKIQLYLWCVGARERKKEHLFSLKEKFLLIVFFSQYIGYWTNITNKYTVILYKKLYFRIFTKQYQSVKTIYFQIYFITENGDVLDIFLVYFKISYLTATTQPLDIENIWHCALTLLTRKTFAFWLHSFLVFLAYEHEKWLF